MESVNKYLDTLFTFDIKAKEFVQTAAGRIPRSKYPDVPFTNRDYEWKLKQVDENNIKRLHDAAINHVATLPKESIENLSNLYNSNTRFGGFLEFMKQFYVKVADGSHNGLDVSDFKLKMERFNCRLPEKGAVDKHFIDDLLGELFTRSAFFDGFKEQIISLLSANYRADTESKDADNLGRIWATVFYFGIGHKFDPKKPTETTLIDLKNQFRESHKVGNTEKGFDKHYYVVKNIINSPEGKTITTREGKEEVVKYSKRELSSIVDAVQKAIPIIKEHYPSEIGLAEAAVGYLNEIIDELD